MRVFAKFDPAEVLAVSSSLGYSGMLLRSDNAVAIHPSRGMAGHVEFDARELAPAPVAG